MAISSHEQIKEKPTPLKEKEPECSGNIHLFQNVALFIPCFRFFRLKMKVHFSVTAERTKYLDTFLLALFNRDKATKMVGCEGVYN